MPTPRKGTRHCERCKKNRQLKSFAPAGKICFPCQKAGRRRSSRHAYVEKTYGLSGEDYQALFAAQGSCCAICKGTRARYDLDHDHDLEHLGVYAVRGICCARCNRQLLTACRNDPVIALALYEYLVNPPAKVLFDW